MSSKLLLKTEYAIERRLEVFFTGREVQVNNEGTALLCQCSEFVTIIELSSGKIISKIYSEEDEVTSISLSPNNLTLAVGCNSATLKHYDVRNLETPSLIASVKSYHRGPITGMCWDPLSMYLATGSTDGTARVWDLKNKFCTHSLKGASGIFRVLLFNKDFTKCQWLFGAADSTIYIWKLLAGESTLLAQLQSHTSAVTGLELTHENCLISCGLDKVLILWDLKTFSSIKIVPMFESLSGVIAAPKDLSYIDGCADDSCIITMGNKGSLSVWNIMLGKELWRSEDLLVAQTEKEVLLVNKIAYVPKFNSVLVATHDHSIILYNLMTNKIWKQLAGYNDEIIDVIFMGDKDSFLVVASNSPVIKIYENVTLSCHFATGHTGNVLGLAKHPTRNNIFASCSHDNTTKVWRLLESGTTICLATASGHTHSIGCVVLAPDFLITGSKDMCIKRWVIDERGLDGSGTQESLSSSRTVKAHLKDINSVAISTNLLLIASCSQDKTAKIWDSQTLELEGILSGHKKSIWCIRFSPVDRIVATSSADGSIKIWSLSNLTNVATLEGHEVAVLRLDWISNGLQLISTASDGLLKLWSLKDKTCVGTFDEHSGRTFALAVSDNGGKVCTAGSDSCIVWWRDITEETREQRHLEEQKVIEEEQTLLNLLHEKKWKKALQYAIHLRQPFRALTTLTQLLDETPSELTPVLRTLKDEELSLLLDYTVQWNTKTRNVRESQSIINYMLKERLPEEIEALPDWQLALEGLLPYTERHLKRLICLLQSSTILNYVTTGASFAPEESALRDSNADEDLELLRSIPSMSGDVMALRSTEEVETVETTRENFLHEEVVAEDSEEEEEAMEASNEEEKEVSFFSEEESISSKDS